MSPSPAILDDKCVICCDKICHQIKIKHSTFKSSSDINVSTGGVISRWNYLYRESLSMLFGLPLNHPIVCGMFPEGEVCNHLCNRCIEDVSNVHHIFWQLNSLENKLIKLQGLIFQRLLRRRCDIDIDEVKTEEGKNVDNDIGKSLFDEINSNKELWPQGTYMSRWKKAQENFGEPRQLPVTSNPNNHELPQVVIKEEPGQLIYDEVSDDAVNDPDFLGDDVSIDDGDADLNYEKKIKTNTRKTHRRKKLLTINRRKTIKSSRTVPKIEKTSMKLVCKEDPSICSRTYSRRKDLTSHIKQFHRARKYPCEHEGCVEKFISEGSLKLHRIKVHGFPREKKFPCDVDPSICTRVFSMKKELSEHMKSYHKGRTHTCNHEGCHEKFKTETKLELHKVKAHGYEKAISMRVCEICGKEMLTKQFPHHLRRHLGQGNFTCQRCSMEFPSSKEFDNHEQLHNKVESTLPFTCVIPDCQTLFTNSMDLKNHVTNCHLSNWLTCHLCGMKKQNEFFLKIHLKFHERVKKVICDECPKAFVSESALKHHKEQEHSVVKPKFTCKICGNVFSLKKNVDRHMRTHNNDKRYKCSICLKEFFYSHGLKKHEEIHSGTKKYECEFCGKRFKQMQNLKQHLKTQQHKGQKNPKFNTDCEQNAEKETAEEILGN